MNNESRILPHTGRKVEHAAVQRDIMASGNILQQVKLQVFNSPHGILRFLDTAPAPAVLPALFAKA
jgi:hypothetical protein